MGNERVEHVNGVELCTETFGSPADPAILLIGGMSSSMDWWEDEFCARLAAGGRHVIRYDLRDTGRSTTYPPGRPGYTGADLGADAIALLDTLGIEAAHVVGISMGGGIAQTLAVEHPSRLATLTLMSTSPALDDAPGDLPPMAPELAAFFEAAGNRPDPDWTDGAAVARMLIEDQRAFMRGDIDEARLRAVIERVVERSTDLAAMGNHAVLEPGPAPAATLAGITAPALVIHGTDDPLFPFPHGEALAREIPVAALLALPEVGHETPPARTWDVVVPTLLRHTAGN